MHEAIKLSKVINIRIRDMEQKQIKAIVNEALDNTNQKKYESESHFGRCAILRLIREELPFLKF